MKKNKNQVPEQAPGFLRVFSKMKAVYVAIDSIHMLVPEGNYCRIVTPDYSYTYTKPMATVQRYLSDKMELVRLGKCACVNLAHPIELDYWKCKLTMAGTTIEIAPSVRWNLYRILHLKKSNQPYQPVVESVVDLSLAGERLLRRILIAGDPKVNTPDRDTVRFSLPMEEKSEINTARSLEKKGLIFVEEINRIVYASSLSYRLRLNQLSKH